MSHRKVTRKKKGQTIEVQIKNNVRIMQPAMTQRPVVEYKIKFITLLFIYTNQKEGYVNSHKFRKISW